jgi:RNA polymerase sigma-70 factor (ECF subfamily)
MRLSVNDDDARDLASAIAGDQDAFARIYDRHAAVVLSLCRQKSASAGDVSNADDACQETFFRAFRLLPRVNGQISGSGGLRPWLYAIARRVCSEAKRSLNRRRIHESKAMTLTMADTTTRAEAAALAGERDALQRERLEHLSAAIESLNDDERLALHLYYLEHDPVAAAGDALRLSRSGYYKLLAKAREKLAAAMHVHREAAK